MYTFYFLRLFSLIVIVAAKLKAGREAVAESVLQVFVVPVEVAQVDLADLVGDIAAGVPGSDGCHASEIK